MIEAIGNRTSYVANMPMTPYVQPVGGGAI